MRDDAPMFTPEPASTVALAPDHQRHALTVLRRTVPMLHELLAMELKADVQGWVETLDHRLLPRLSPDFPLIAAITGGGSSGKSTLFNSIVGSEVSTAGGRAGLNRRVLVAVHPDQAARPAFLTELFRPFGSPPLPLQDRMVLTTQGPPVYVANSALPPSVILLDTPDFDVGVAGEYLNRGVAAPVLTAADVLIYIFTNATYNAKPNTDFIREQLTRVGRRSCILVYRVYESFSEEDVRAHAETVATNLYGDGWQDHVIATFRADDSNVVAKGDAPMVPRRLDGGPGLIETLAAMDPRALRESQNGEMVGGVTAAAERAVQAARWERDALALYRDGLRLAEGHAVAGALAHLPLNAIIDRIRTIFERTDSGFLRFSRKAGRVTGAPLRGLLKLIGGGDSKADAEGGAVDPVELTRSALIESANALRRQALSEELTAATTATDPDGAQILGAVARLRATRGLTGTERPLAEPSAIGGGVSVYISAHPALDSARGALAEQKWADELVAIAERAESLMELPPALDAELEQLIVDFRADMPFWKRARAAMIASLNLIPPVLGITYVLATVDPVGGSTLSAKLSSVFGLNDLWATVTIPASSGLDDATRSHLKKLLDPVVQRWLASRAVPVEAVFRAHVTRGLMEVAERRLALADEQLAALGAALTVLKDPGASR
ncbi:MAG: hypothetical protein ACI9MR_002725 [Myxococcota bacterium]|jgi:hypothetical protein